MSEIQCPLCGSSISAEQAFCADCDELAQNRASLIISEQEIDDENVAEDDNINEEEQTLFPEKKPRNKKPFIFFFILLVLCLAVGATYYLMGNKARENKEKELEFWYSCIEENTPLAYSKYLLAYTDGEFYQVALDKIAELRGNEYQAWEKVKGSYDLDSYYSFLSIYPDTPFKNEIRNIMDSLSWRIAEKENSTESYLVYIENSESGNITGEYIPIAQERYDYLKQLTELEGEELEKVKTIIGDYFRTLSENKFKDLESFLSPQLSDFYNQKDILSSVIVKSMQNEIVAKTEIKKMEYLPLVDSIRVIKDSKGILRTDFNIEKTTFYKNRKKKQTISIENLSIELDSLHRIKALFIKRRVCQKPLNKKDRRF